MNLTFKKFLLGYVAVLAVLLASTLLAKQTGGDSPLSVNFLDVGQGDATLVQYLGQYQMLIDGGPDGNKLLGELGKVMPPTDKQIEIVVLTHPDRDHLAGLIDVVKNYEVKLLLHNGQEAETEIFQELKRHWEDHGIRSEMIAEGSTIALGERLELHAFNPDELPATAGDERNDYSVVLRMDWGENSFLLTGDSEMGTERDMLSDGEDLDVDWLKVGHHGSKSSTSEEFLRNSTPQYALISAGKTNSYGHPHQETLDRLLAHKIQILRTDELGTIRIECQDHVAPCRIK